MRATVAVMVYLGVLLVSLIVFALHEPSQVQLVCWLVCLLCFARSAGELVRGGQ